METKYKALTFERKLSKDGRKKIIGEYKKRNITFYVNLSEENQKKVNEIVERNEKRLEKNKEE